MNDQIREQFERWVLSNGGSVDLVDGSEYRSAPTECAWSAWLANERCRTLDAARQQTSAAIECTCAAQNMPFGRCCKAPTSSDVIAGLEMALSQAATMIERQQHVMQRAMDAWDCTTHQKNGDGRLWQCMEELRGECGKQPNHKLDPLPAVGSKD